MLMLRKIKGGKLKKTEYIQAKVTSGRHAVIFF